MFQWRVFPPKALHAITYSDARLNIWEGSVRSGKTISSIIRWIMYLRQAPRNANLLMAAKTERTLKRNILDVMTEILGEGSVEFRFGAGEAKILGRTVYVAGAVDERSQDKIRGVTLSGAYCDEITLFPESFWLMLLSRLSEPGAKLFGTTNPDSVTHWFKRGYLDRARTDPNDVSGIDLKRFHFTLDDNPTLDPEYVESLKREYTGLWYKRFIEGQWCIADGLVYSQFDSEKHVTDIKERQFKKYIVGCDYGTNNPCSFVMIGFDDIRGPYYVVDEYYYNGGERAAAQKTNSEYTKDLIEFISGKSVGAIYVDPSALGFITELKRNGLYPNQANNGVVEGIRFCASLIGNDRLIIGRHCEHIQEELLSYVWDTEYCQRYGEDRPIKQNDHAMDAMRYALYTHFGSLSTGILGGFKR